MALSILDGNQSATTLSTILSSGQHITAHTVVSLGTQAITDMRGAVSGSVVSISNLPSTQTIAGTVTANGGNFAYAQDEDTSNPSDRGVLIGWRDDANGSFRNTSDAQPLPISGTVTANGVWDSNNPPSVAGTGDSNPVYGVGIAYASVDGAVVVSDTQGLPISGTVTIGSALPAGTNRIGVVTIGAGTVTLGASTAQIGSVTASVSGTVTANIGGIANSVTLPVRLVAERTGGAPTGEDTLLTCNSNGMLLVDAQSSGTSVLGFDGNAFVQVKPVSGSSVTIGNSLTIATLPALVAGTAQIGSVTVGNTVTIAGTVTANPTGTQTIAGSVTLGVGTSQIGSVTASISNSVTIASFATSVTARLINPAGTSVTYAEVGTAGNPSIDVLSVQGVTSGTPLNVYPLQGTTVSSTNFTSLTSSTTIAPAVTMRESLTVFNEGAGNLHISPGATCTTISYQVRLSAGDYWECPDGQLSLAHTAVFATAGTARVTQVS